ncbi:MAG: hypothetical protein ACRYG6_16630 [Janthinobacterium lividum]
MSPQNLDDDPPLRPVSHSPDRTPAPQGADIPALRTLAGFAETALPAMLLLYLAASERHADTLPELKQVIDTLSEVPANLDAQGPEPIHAAVARLYATISVLRGRIE